MLIKTSDNFLSQSGFEQDSPPYLLATDFPFLLWTKFDFKNKTLLFIADSGDNILTLWPLKPQKIIAVDIATKACLLNELKLMALRRLSFKEFISLFAPKERHPIFPQATKELKIQLINRIKDTLSPQTQSWLEHELQSDFPLNPNWWQLTFVHLIPHFAHKEAFKVIKAAARDYPIYNLPIELALEEIPEDFDFIYLSNIPEYIKQNLKEQDQDKTIYPTLKDLYLKALKKTTKNGLVASYCFGNALKNPDYIKEERMLAEAYGLNLKLFTINLTTPLISGLFFKHTLVVMR